MYTALSPELRDTEQGREARGIVRSCVHCGMCLAACPTYRLLGDELDSPRGRIYLIKGLLEGDGEERPALRHLDRCLTCRACESVCPSGVRYADLLDIGRRRAERARSWRERGLRALMCAVLPYRRRFALALKVARLLRPTLPLPLRRRVPLPEAAGSWPRVRHRRRVILFQGCVQSAAAPEIDAAAARILDRIGISAVRADGETCCGAISHHFGRSAQALALMRRNVRVWSRLLDGGCEAVLVTSSGCDATIRDYGRLLGDGPDGDLARRVAESVRDPCTLLQREDVQRLRSLVPARPPRVAFQAPCTLQHALRLGGTVEGLLERLGFALTPVRDASLCCGSAGTYSLLQPRIAHRLRQRKLETLLAGSPDVVATANVGCLLHLQAEASLPVRHWLGLLDPDGPPAT